MITYIVAFALAMALSMVLTPMVRTVALSLGWVDGRSARKVHLRPIPRLGGLAIVIGFYAPFLGLAIYRNSLASVFYADSARVVGFFCGGLAIVLLGLYDDLRGANAQVKLAVQLAVAGMMYALGFQIHWIATPFGPGIDLGYLALPFTLLWIVGVINAMNLIDGLDGLASGVAFFAVVMNFVVAITRGDLLMCVLMSSLAGALAGFLVFNFNPASIFMGDTGSLFLGFILATSSIAACEKGPTAVSMLVPILALGLPIMDTLLAMVRRFIMGRPMFSADREHIHHQLLKLGYTHRRVVLTMYGICAFFALAALGATYATAPQAAGILVVVSGVVILLMRKLGYLDLARGEMLADTRRKNLALRSAVNDIGEALRSASDLAAIWSCVQRIVEPLHLGYLSLRFEGAGAAVKTEVFHLEVGGPPAADAFRLVLPLEHDGVHRGELCAQWEPTRIEIGRDDELALELLVDHVNRALTRCRPEARRLRLVHRA
jgi:UDP-GlcNAc:undecaprenyl-phosphate GlcNAc-1-phosphate transferase